jgi:DNA-binding transcriptional LysR family regulator
MELHHLRCAVAIADYGSFTDAAASLYLTQPSLSYAIGRLERELGARLFDRTSTGARLTAAGSAFIDPARRALKEAETSKEAVDAVTGLLRGELRVVGIRTAVIETAQLVGAFHERHPGVRILIEEPTRDAGVIELVRSGRCDIGVLRSNEAPDDLRSVPAGSREIVAILPEHLATKGKTISIETLSHLPMVVPLLGSSARVGHDAFFHDVDSPPIGAECSHQDTMVELVRHGVGAALVSSSAANAIRIDGIAVRVLRPSRRDTLSVVSRNAASPAAESFCAAVLAERR